MSTIWRRHRPIDHSAQRGVSLLFALLSLLTLSLAALALARAVQTGSLVIGNIGFRNDGVYTSALATDQALSWLSGNGNGSTLDSSGSTGTGYYAWVPGRLDPTGNKTSSSDRWSVIDWDGNCMGLTASQYLDCNTKPNIAAASINGNTVKWVIFRMCSQPGPSTSPTSGCVFPNSTSVTMEQGELVPGGRFTPPAPTPYFQVFVRVEGPRNAVAYTDTVVHY